jgi:tetraacyldisaccharide 4'-kinase
MQSARRSLYRYSLLPRARVDKPVISIGSLFAGGAGKTPFARYLSAELSPRRVAILSRGYKGDYSGQMRVNANSDPGTCGDEPVLLARQSPTHVWIAKNRSALAKSLSPDYDVFILDDGYQHLPLRRDLNICLLPDVPLDSVLPAGLLREWPDALRDADFVVGIQAVPAWARDYYDGPSGVIDLRPGLWESGNGSSAPPRRVLAFCGVARPDRFMTSLREFQLTESLVFADHHPFTSSELERLWKRAVQSGAQALVTTAKDAVRISKTPGSLPLFWRDVDVVWKSGRAGFEARLAKVISGRA